MSKLITFEEAIRTNLIQEGDFINPEELFSKETTEIILNPQETGIDQQQRFSREVLKWFYAKSIENIPTLWGSTTSTKLHLKGYESIRNGLALVRHICSQLYSNFSYMVAYATAKEDINHLIMNTNTRALILNNGEKSFLGSLNCVLNYRPLDLTGEEKKLFYIFESYFDVNDSQKCCCAGLIPAISIYLPKRVFVDIESKDKDGIWKLISQK